MEARMNDFVFLGLTVLLFALSLGLIRTLDGLQEDKP
jgi:hypothetical protein